MKRLKEIAISAEDIFFEHEGIDLPETYDILDDNEEYIITKKDLWLIMQTNILDNYIMEQAENISQFELYINTITESDSNIEWEHNSEVWLDRLCNIYSKMRADYLYSLDKTSMWKYIPFTFEDLYNQRISPDTRERLNISFETVMDKDYFYKIFEIWEKFKNGQ